MVCHRIGNEEGGKKGIKAIASLVFTFICIVYLMFPLIYKGASPILITIIIAFLSTLLILGLLGGASTKTASAIVGTTARVVIAAVAAILFGKAAGIIISALGATMDVGMSIASTIQEFTLVVNYAYDLSYRQVMNSYVLGIEIMQGLSGSLGVVLTVPVTAAIAAFLTGRKKRPVT